MPADLGLGFAMANAAVSSYPVAFTRGVFSQLGSENRQTASSSAANQRLSGNANLQAQGEATFAKAQQFAMARQQEVITHEHAHKAGLGSLGGNISYGYSTLQVPMGPGFGSKTITYINSGAVPVNFPAMPQLAQGQPATPSFMNRLQQVQQQLKQIAFAASAPKEMSSADQSVATQAMASSSRASALLAQAQQQQTQQGPQLSPRLAGNRLNVVA